FEIVKRVVNTHAPNLVPETATIRVDFAETPETTDITARLSNYETRIAMGIWSAVDALLADNPDIRDREVAMTILQERRDEAVALGKENAGFRSIPFDGENP
ncbi:MAG: hypothetical protein KIT82_23255, partial [Bradyrhizobium sp.]|nr:hypothetical protein [Bradyrhizobium sp.]